MARDARLLPGAAELIAMLHEMCLRLGLVTSKSRKMAEEIAEKFCFPMEVIATCQDVEHPKPHPESLLSAARQMQLPAEALVYVGDAAGMDFTAVTTGGTPKGRAFLISPSENHPRSVPFSVYLRYNMSAKEKIMFDKTEFVFTDTYGKRVATFNVTWEMIQSIYFDNCKVAGFFKTKPSQRITIIMRRGAPLVLLSCKEKSGFEGYLDGLRRFARDNRISLFDTLDDPEPHSPVRAKL